MTRTRQYNSGPALRHALEERIYRISRDEAIDLQRLRRQVAFDRFAFRVGEAGMDLDGAPYGGVRYPVEAIDLALLVRSGIMDASRVAEAIRRTFGRRGTHDLPGDLAPPPESWYAPFAAMAEECSLGIGAAAAFEEVASYLRRVRPAAR